MTLSTTSSCRPRTDLLPGARSRVLSGARSRVLSGARSRVLSGARSRAVSGARARVALVLLLAATSVGCVTRGTHEEVVSERDDLRRTEKRLAKRVQLLEASNESLSGERVTLIEEVEDLRVSRDALELERASLSEQVDELTTLRDRLTADLAAREQQVEVEQQEVEKLRGTYDGLVEELQDEVAAGRIEIERLREGVNVKLAQEILFPTGSAQISSEGRDVLRRVAQRLQGERQWIEVHGHTDDRAIHGRLARRYPSNWELGAARASAVVRLLEGRGVPPARLRGVSYGPNRPVASNASAAGRARNRRIEIRLSAHDLAAGASEPAPVSAPAEAAQAPAAAPDEDAPDVAPPPSE